MRRNDKIAWKGFSIPSTRDMHEIRLNVPLRQGFIEIGRQFLRKYFAVFRALYAGY